MSASVTESDGRFPTERLIPEKRDVYSLKSRQAYVVPAKVLDVSNAVNDDRTSDKEGFNVVKEKSYLTFWFH